MSRDPHSRTQPCPMLCLPSLFHHTSPQLWTSFLSSLRLSIHPLSLSIHSPNPHWGEENQIIFSTHWFVFYLFIGWPYNTNCKWKGDKKHIHESLKSRVLLRGRSMMLTWRWWTWICFLINYVWPKEGVKGGGIPPCNCEPYQPRRRKPWVGRHKQIMLTKFPQYIL